MRKLNFEGHNQKVLKVAVFQPEMDTNNDNEKEVQEERNPEGISLWTVISVLIMFVSAFIMPGLIGAGIEVFAVFPYTEWQYLIVVWAQGFTASMYDYYNWHA